MISYNGVDLTGTIPVKIEDIQVSPVSLQPVARQRTIKFGSDFVRLGGGTRTITISFALLESTLATRETTMQSIRDWAFSKSEGNLILPEFPGKHLECICTQLPEHSYRKWWENKLRIVFTCFNNPFWTSNTIKEATTGNAFNVYGSAPPIMTIEHAVSSPLTNVLFASLTESMIFSAIPAGNLVIDLNHQTAAVNNTSIMSNYVTTSTWIQPVPGEFQVISGVGTIKYRERWI